MSIVPSLSPGVHALPAPAEVHSKLPLPQAVRLAIARHRDEIARILAGDDTRLLVIVGPCSVHDPEAAVVYAEWLAKIAERHSQHLKCVMRVYVEKARTRLGWKGLLPDPRLDGSERMDEGVIESRSLLKTIAALGVPIATEMVSPVAPAYLGDLVSWAAIGARTVASPVHRELASLLPCPVGFKNGLDGDVGVAVDAVAASSRPQHALSMMDDGTVAWVEAPGNEAAHVVLRGGRSTNFDDASIAAAAILLRANGIRTGIVIDASHGNSRGDYRHQLTVVHGVAELIAGGNGMVAGMMVESHLVEGRQDAPATIGQSITDGCIGLDDTLLALEALAGARQRRLGADPVCVIGNPEGLPPHASASRVASTYPASRDEGLSPHTSRRRSPRPWARCLRMP